MFKKLRLDTVAYDKAIYSNIVQMIKLRNPEEFKDDSNGRSNHACSGIANILVEAGIIISTIYSFTGICYKRKAYTCNQNTQDN